MKNLFVVILVFVSVLLHAQSETGLDSSNATVQRFGSDALEIKGASAGARTFAIYLVRDDDTWAVTRADVAGEHINRVDVQFSLASVTDEAVIISNIIVDGTRYSGVFPPAPFPPPRDRRNALPQEGSANVLAVSIIPSGSPESSLTAPVPVDQTDDSNEPPLAEVIRTDQPGSNTVVSKEGEEPDASAAVNGSVPTGASVAPSATERILSLERRLGLLEEQGLYELLQLQEAGQLEVERIDALEEQFAAGADQINLLASLLREMKSEELVASDYPASQVRATTDPILSLADAREKLLSPLWSGFDGATVALGTWETGANYAFQNDPDACFAKLRIPLVQKLSDRVLYRFRVRSPAEGWVGAGLHVFASGVERQKGYGHGDSVLVWLTRDAAAYGTERTYLQVYRSTTDVEMERIAHVALPEHIGRGVRVEVLLDPVTNYVTVGVDGEERFRYFLFFPLAAGYEVALRSLDRAEFSDFLVTGESVQ